MKITNILTPSLINVRLKSETKDELFEELIQLLVDAGKIPDRALALAALHNREMKMSTGINRQLAIPHAIVPGIDHLAMAMGISDQGINFGAPDGQPVRMIFMVLADPGHPEMTLQCLAEICRLFSKDSIRKKICTARMPSDVLDIVRREEA